MNILATQMVMAAAQMEPRLFDLDMQLLSDAVLMIIAVFALFLIASNALFNPVRNMMQSRQDRIKSELDTAAADMAQAKALKEEYETKLREINKEAEEILGEARKKALANENKIVSEAKEEAARINAAFAVSNLRNEGDKVYLRIVSDNCPCEGASSAQPRLEDVYMYYFEETAAGHMQ